MELRDPLSGELRGIKISLGRVEKYLGYMALNYENEAPREPKRGAWRGLGASGARRKKRRALIIICTNLAAGIRRAVNIAGHLLMNVDAPFGPMRFRRVRRVDRGRCAVRSILARAVRRAPPKLVCKY